ncbi:uncharacterized protein V6R79_021645 [Siganus canaliculatus]
MPTTTTTTTTMPTTTTTTTMPTTTTQPTTTACPSGYNMTCTWSSWINLGQPTTGPNGGENETISSIISAGYNICSSPIQVECQASLYPGLPMSQLGQTVTCNKDVGLICYNNQQGTQQVCLDYQIRVRCCDCQMPTSTTMTTTTMTSTTTTTTMPTTTTTTTTMPTTTTTTTMPTTTTQPTTTACPSGYNMTCTWSSWINLGQPTTGSDGGENETISSIISAGYNICSSPIQVECQASLYPGLPMSQLGQTVTCNKDVGLICYNNQQGTQQVCLDYQIRVRCCDCQMATSTTTTTTSMTSTTTTTTMPTTTTTTTTMPTTTTTTTMPTTTTQPTTTACPSGYNMTCTWSPWINLGKPTTGPNGGENESISSIISAGYNICSSPLQVECQASLYPGLPMSQLGQAVTCNKDVGLICINQQQGLQQVCLDYEIRFKCCDCQTPTTSTAMTTTTTTMPSTTTETPMTYTTTTPRTQPQCACYHNGTRFSPGSMVYNETDYDGYCYIGYCADNCTVVTVTQKCSPIDCVDVYPPRQNGETWKSTNCQIGTCVNGNVTYSTPACPAKKPIVCANNFPAVEVMDADGCCSHYECQCICYGWGDPHYVTFDGTYYGFQGNCSYWLVKEITPKYNFSVMIDNYYCGALDGLSCPQSITVFYNGYKIFITQKDINGIVTNQVSVNDKVVSPAYQNSLFRLTTTGIDTVLVIPSINAKITFSGLMFSIYLPFSKFGYNTEGQCGTCDNNRTDDCLLPNGQIDSSCPDMANHWHVNNSRCDTPAQPTPTPPPSTCNATICEIIKSSVFEPCHAIVPYDPFVVACNFDVCSMHLDHIGCSSLQTYAEACASAGVCIDWRSSTKGLCTYTCQSPKVYDPCGPAVEPTCDSWYNEKFIYTVNEFSMMTNMTMEGCYCPNGSYQLSSSSNECVPSCELCRLPNGQWKKANATWTDGCQECTCEEDTLQVTCRHVSCPALPPLSCNKEGQVKVTETVGCCQQEICECNMTKCPAPITSCPLGFTVNATVGVCCVNYTCVPQPVCVYNNHVYHVGDKVSTDTCQQCNCSNQIDSSSHLHTVQCQPITCDTHCPLGYEYQNMSGQCCGNCVQTSCVATLPDNSTYTVQPGKIWSPSGYPCEKFECVKIGNQYITVEAKTICPPYDPAGCIPGTETMAPDGCCRTCVPNTHTCNVSTTTVIVESQGCHSKDMVNVTSCGGACGTFTYYNSKMKALQHTCSCCQELSTSERQIQLSCPDNTEITYTYTHIDSCGCLNTQCASSQSGTETSTPATMKSRRRRR